MRLTPARAHLPRHPMFAVAPSSAPRVGPASGPRPQPSPTPLGKRHHDSQRQQTRLGPHASFARLTPLIAVNARLASLLNGRTDPLTAQWLGKQGPRPEIIHGPLRPDGQLGKVARGADPEGLRIYLSRWSPFESG
ncbi:hypothetical protein [Streptomyces sp. Agncl-13]|uniref:hypothetical protein n=1 Tax=Streptomyces sp. Agncl-13 TaxID=3400628 RepID=UPI003A885377